MSGNPDGPALRTANCVRRQRDKYLAFAGAENLLEGKLAFAFLGLEIARSDEAAEPAIGGAVGRIGQHFKAVGSDQPRADEELDVALARFVVSAHHAGKRIAVGDADGGQAEFVGARHHFLGMRGAAQEGKVSRDREFGIGVHRIYSRRQFPTQKDLARTSAPLPFRARKVLRGRARSGGRPNPRRGSNRGSELAAAHFRESGNPDLGPRLRGDERTNVACATIRRRCVPGPVNRRRRRSCRARKTAAADRRVRAQ